jgi:hypothetical protein
VLSKPQFSDGLLGGFTVASENPVYVLGGNNTGASDPCWTVGTNNTPTLCGRVLFALGNGVFRGRGHSAPAFFLPLPKGERTPSNWSDLQRPFVTWDFCLLSLSCYER